MARSSRFIAALFPPLCFAVALSAQTRERPGFVVLHFAPSACQAQPSIQRTSRTLFRGYRTSDGQFVTIDGYVATRFKPSTSERQIDSLIATLGVEASNAVARGCRRYVLRAASLGDDPGAVAEALVRSGLVDYAIPDRGAGRSEGITTDSFYVDIVALANSINRSGAGTEAAPISYDMGQVLGGYSGPLMRVDAATIAAHMTAGNSSMSALELVRSYGLTTLRLSIPDRAIPATVRVMLYSLDGTPVRKLVNDALGGGHYLVGWDGLDDRGRRVQPGVYIAVMTAENFRETHRLVVR
jgi:hypothetical protein